MTIPWMMNCPHSTDSWCLDCVVELGNEMVKYRTELNRLKKPHCEIYTYKELPVIIHWLDYAGKNVGDQVVPYPKPNIKIEPIIHQCCGCSCDVCANGHTVSGQHTEACYERAMKELEENKKSL